MQKKTSSGSASPLLVLGKITSILDAFDLSDPELTLTEIRERTDLPQSTVQRLVANMVDFKLLDRVDDRFRVGMKMAYWSAAATRGVPEIELIAPLLSSLRDLTGETTAFFISEGSYRVCVAMAETRQTVRREMHVGKIVPIHVGSAGHVLLAWNPARLQTVLSDPLEQMTDETAVTPEALTTRVKEARKLGYSISAGEREDGASGLSAPVFDSMGRIHGAVSILGPSSRMTRETCESWAPSLLATAERITRVLGGRFPGEKGI